MSMSVERAQPRDKDKPHVIAPRIVVIDSETLPRIHLTDALVFPSSRHEEDALYEEVPRKTRDFERFYKWMCEMAGEVPENDVVETKGKVGEQVVHLHIYHRSLWNLSNKFAERQITLMLGTKEDPETILVFGDGVYEYQKIPESDQSKRQYRRVNESPHEKAREKMKEFAGEELFSSSR